MPHLHSPHHCARGRGGAVPKPCGLWMNHRLFLTGQGAAGDPDPTLCPIPSASQRGDRLPRSEHHAAGAGSPAVGGYAWDGEASRRPQVLDLQGPLSASRSWPAASWSGHCSGPVPGSWDSSHRPSSGDHCIPTQAVSFLGLWSTGGRVWPP